MKTSIFTLAITFLVLSSCEKAFFIEEPANNPEDVFEQLWLSFDHHYGGFEQRGVDWDVAYDQFRPFVTATTTDDELYEICSELLSILDDGHVSLIAPNRDEFRSNRYYREKIGYDLLDLDVIKNNYLDSGYEVDPYEGGYIRGTIGDAAYLYLPWVSDNMPVLETVLDEYADASGLIIDMRHSNGGDFTWAFSYIKRLFKTETEVFSTRTRNAPERDAFDEWYQWSVSAATPYWDKPIVVITNRFTISASERTALAFKVLPNTIMVGDTTNGALATKIGRELQNTWNLGLPTQQIVYVDGTNYEGPGIDPDIYILNDRDSLDAGIDQMLEEALRQF